MLLKYQCRSRCTWNLATHNRTTEENRIARFEVLPVRSLAYPAKTESVTRMYGNPPWSIIGPYENITETVKRRNLKRYVHVTRSDGLTKVILLGTVEGRRIRSRPKKRWPDNIAEWTGKSFAETQAWAWHTAGRSGEKWWGSPSWRAPTAPRGAKGPRQCRARQCTERLVIMC